MISHTRVHARARKEVSIRVSYDWCRHRRRVLVPLGALPGVPNYERLTFARSTVTATRSVTGLIPALSCRSCRPNAPFAELVRLSRTSIADEMREEYARKTPASDSIVLNSVIPFKHA
jgi:hypothetical protein